MEVVSKRSNILGSVNAPSSKSFAQRALAAALLVEGQTTLLNMDMELCADTNAALSVIQGLGASVRVEGESKYVITGGVKGGKLLPKGNTVSIGESGLSTRMFTPIASLASEPIRIMGYGSILNRPMDMMLKPLSALGVEVMAERGRFLPITVHGPIRGGEVVVDGSISSQLITGLLMALPLAEGETTLTVLEPMSIPYIDMTLDILTKFGIEVSHIDHSSFYIEGGQSYHAGEYEIEGDWSAASCLLVAGAIAGEVVINNLKTDSIQADVAMMDALSMAGGEVTTTLNQVKVRRGEDGLHGFNFDATHSPDLFPALVALAANCEGVSVIKGTNRLKYKESDRAEVLREVFGRMGIKIDISKEDTMRVVGGEIRSTKVSSHNDHRIAMAVAVAALTCEQGVVIKEAEAVDKSYPGFWRDLESLKVL